MKNCNKCNEVKSYEFFSKHKRYKDGYQTTCKSCVNKNTKKYKKENKEKCVEYMKKYYLQNKQHFIEYAKKYKKENKENSNKYLNKYYKNRRKKDFIFKFKCNVRCLISSSFKRGTNQFKKTLRTEEILGCTIDEFRYYISLKFTNGMSLENHGEWHLDHIIPLASAETKEDILKLNHYTNFQPLWAADNISKGDKIINKQLLLL